MAARPEDVDIAASAARGSSPPEDRRGFVYRACFFLGAGILFPWNSYITAVDYFERVHPGKHVDRVFGVLYFLPNLLMLVLVLRFGNLVPPGARVRLGFCLFLLCLLVPAFTSNLGVLCAGIALNGVADALAQGSLFAQVASMPETYTQALMGGTSLSGLIVSLLRVVTKASFPSTDSGAAASASTYFVAAALWVLACLVLYGELERSEVFRWHVARAARARRAGEVREGVREGVRDVWENGDGDEYESELALTNAASSSSSSSSLVGMNRTRTSRTRRGMWRVEDDEGPGPGTTLRDAVAIASRVKHHAFAVAVTYVVTLSIFPGVLAEDLRDDSMGEWFPVALIAAFNLADVVGKCVPGVYPAAATAFSPRTMAAMAAARVLFVPAFMATAGLSSDGSSGGGVVSAGVVLTLALGVTNGWYSASVMMTAPKAVSAAECEACGTIMVFFLLSGLTIGAFCGWLWLV